MTETLVPTSWVVHPSGVEIRYFAEDKKEKVKRHYMVRRAPGFQILDETTEWREVPSVTTVQKILHKEALLSWYQRRGADGVVRLFNQGVIYPGEYQGQRVMATTDPQLGHILVGEDEAINLLKRYKLDGSSFKKKGGERGQSAHDALEVWSKTGMMPNPATYPVTEQGYVQALVNFLTESGAESVRAEVLVASVEDGWAGRYDNDLLFPKSVELMTHHTPAGRGNQLTWFENGLYRIDAKTAKDVFPENGEQLEAYEKGAVECGLEETLQRCVLHLSENSRYKLVPVGSGTPTIEQKEWSTYEDFRLTLLKWRAMEDRKARRKQDG